MLCMGVFCFLDGAFGIFDGAFGIWDGAFGIWDGAFGIWRWPNTQLPSLIASSTR